MDCDFTMYSSDRLHFIFTLDAYKQPQGRPQNAPNCIIFFFKKCPGGLGTPPSMTEHPSCSLPLDGFAISSMQRSPRHVAVPATFISRPATQIFGRTLLPLLISSWIQYPRYYSACIELDHPQSCEKNKSQVNYF